MILCVYKIWIQVPCYNLGFPSLQAHEKNTAMPKPRGTTSLCRIWSQCVYSLRTFWQRPACLMYLWGLSEAKLSGSFDMHDQQYALGLHPPRPSLIIRPEDLSFLNTLTSTEYRGCENDMAHASFNRTEPERTFTTPAFREAPQPQHLLPYTRINHRPRDNSPSMPFAIHRHRHT